MDLSIIIVSWNSTEYLRECLSSIYSEPPNVSFEIVVVDNASDDTCASALSCDFPHVAYLRTDRNIGFGRANNLGYTYSSGDVLLFLNPDTKVIGNAVAQLWRALMANKRTGAVGALLLNKDGTVQTSCVQAFPTITNQLLDCNVLREAFPNWHGWGTQDIHRNAGLIHVDAISGACFMVQRTIFAQVGMFATQYFMYSDDIDLSRRIRAQGYEIACLTDCTILHYGGTSSAKQCEFSGDVLQRESMSRYFRCTRGKFYAAAYRGAIIVAALLRVLVLACLSAATQDPGQRLRLGKWLRILRWALRIDSADSAANLIVQEES